MGKQRQRQNNFAFIDSQNVYKGIQELGWQVDYRRLRRYLLDRYDVQQAYLFMGFLPSQQSMYASLQKAGYVIIFKPILQYKDGTIKGNCDAELVLQAMIDYGSYDQAVILTGDGDFHCLVKYLYGKGKLRATMVPNQHKYSALLKKTARDKLVFMNDLKKKLEHKPK